MKKSIFIALFACFASQIFAQTWRYNNGSNDETLFSRSRRVGFFVSPITEFSDFKHDLTTASGGGIGLIAGDFFIGGYGLGTVNYDRIINEDFDRLEMGHGGFWLGYVAPQHEVVHFFSSVKAGWGAVDIEFDNNNSPDYEDTFFALTPEAGLEVNVFRWFRVGAAVGYRFMSGLAENPSFDTKDFQTMTASLTFRIGGFGRNHDRWDD